MRAYEALRSHVLTGSTLGSAAGLVDLLRHGVAVWMARRSVFSFCAPPAVCKASSPVADEIHTGIVRIVASMALAGQREVRV